MNTHARLGFADCHREKHLGENIHFMCFSLSFGSVASGDPWCSVSQALPRGPMRFLPIDRRCFLLFFFLGGVIVIFSLLGWFDTPGKRPGPYISAHGSETTASLPFRRGFSSQKNPTAPTGTDTTGPIGARSKYAYNNTIGAVDRKSVSSHRLCESC